MHSLKFFLCIAIATTLLSSAAKAESPRQHPLPVPALAQPPVPIEVVGFTQLPRHWEGVTVTMTMVVDEKGIPHDIAGKSPLPADLTARMLPALSQWKFIPARDQQGTPISVRVMIPLQLVDAG